MNFSALGLSDSSVSELNCAENMKIAKALTYACAENMKIAKALT